VICSRFGLIASLLINCLHEAHAGGAQSQGASALARALVGCRFHILRKCRRPFGTPARA
jgi:hypothetical protein